MRKVVALVVIGLALTPGRARAGAPAPKTTKAAAQKLLCANIWLMTSSASAPSTRVSLDDRGEEGGAADVYVNGDMLRIDGQVLQESEREHVDYRYDHGELVCSEVMHTSLMTIQGGDDVPADERAPAFMRVDSLVFDHGKVVQHRFDEAPAANEFHRTSAETLKNAQELFTQASAALRDDEKSTTAKTPDKGTLTMGTPIILGALEKEAVIRIVQERAGQIRACYERELAKVPGVAGKLKMKWVIGSGGKVPQAQVEETKLHDDNIERCLADKIKTWVFPKPKDAALPGGELLRGEHGSIVVVSFPFVFRPGQ